MEIFIWEIYFLGVKHFRVKVVEYNLTIFVVKVETELYFLSVSFFPIPTSCLILSVSTPLSPCLTFPTFELAHSFSNCVIKYTAK